MMWDKFMAWLDSILKITPPIPENEKLRLVKVKPARGIYSSLLLTAKINPQHRAAVFLVCDKIYKNVARYKMVQNATNVPWHVVAAIHSLESSLSFASVLHNGEKIIGTGRKTTKVPHGKGPFFTWEAAAIDALKGRVGNITEWDADETLVFLERYNGVGYKKRGINTPYLWSFTNHYKKGKYIDDNKFDPDSVSKQVGACAIFLGFIERGVYLDGISYAPDVENVAEVASGFTHMHPIDWMRRELGTKEIAGKKDNPRIRWYHTFSKNIGSKEHPDEVPWCASIMNACGVQCGMEISGSALAASYDAYGVDTGDWVEEGDIVTLAQPGRHVTLANKRFNRKNDRYFQGLGGNQADSVKVSIYSCSVIKSARKWKPKPGTLTAPISSKFDAPIIKDDNESTR
jgi:uncharacterized protein (TIGR02594 family)